MKATNAPLLARCSVGGADLAEWMAENGWAVPYRHCKCETIRAASEYARLNQLGIWSGAFMNRFDDLAVARDQQLAQRAADRTLTGAGVTDWAT